MNSTTPEKPLNRPPARDQIRPDWFRASQSQADSEFHSLSWPVRTDEYWRFSDLAAIKTECFTDAPPVREPDRLVGLSTPDTPCSARLVFANNSLIDRKIIDVPGGIIVESIDVAVREHSELLQEFFMAQPVELGSHKYAALHRARMSTGAVIFVPADCILDAPVHCYHWVEGENSTVYPHTLVICGSNSKVTVIDHFQSADGNPAMACGVNDLHLAPGSRLHYAAVQEWSDSTLAFHLNSTIVERNATSTAVAANLGARYVRGESLSRLAGEGARSDMFSLNPLRGARQVDQRTLQDHAAPGASSDLLYLNALDDQSRSIFSGLIKVEEGAHRTDAYQKVRNLMLSDTAEANSMPGLEILADDVRCTHGATSGEINDEELYYLEARGIPKNSARRLITNGFFQTLISRIDDQSVKSLLTDKIDTFLRP